MPLAPGVHLGPYEIVGLAGSGGMGEVYRARDRRLMRDVAIKILPADLASDSDRLRRFETEARAAGSLNHPNILAIYDLGSEDGHPFIVSELLEGETLEARLRGGPLPVRKAIEYGVQIARGLAAAHRRGIVHRDLKPSNLFIGPAGHVKILDFGVAKLSPTRAGPEIATRSMTAQTDPNAVLGTAAYMSPEQVRGDAVDSRSDIFALGATLYEMVAGRRPFDRASPVETMHAILNEDAPDIVRPGGTVVPPAVEQVIRHCLEKDPAERYQSADDLAFNLTMAETGSGVRPAIVGIRRRSRWLAAMAVLGVALAAALLMMRWLPAAAAPPTYQRITFRQGDVYSARFAPDGHTIVYAAAWGEEPVQVYMVRPESTESTPLGYQGANLLAIAPSGELAVLLGYHYLGGFIFTGTLARAPFGGGAPRQVLENIQFADWAPDGSNLAIVREVAGSNRLEYPPGNVLYRTGGWIGSPRFSPHGDRLAFLDYPARGNNAGTVAVVDLRGQHRTLTKPFGALDGLAWSRSGDEVWFTGARTSGGLTLYAVAMDGRQRVVADAPGGMTLADVSSSGRVLLSRNTTRLGILAGGHAQSREHDLSWLDWSLVRDITTDGKTILFDESGAGGGEAGTVYIRATDGSPAVRLGDGVGMAFSPDGKWVLTIARRDDTSEIALLPIGPGEPRRILLDADLSVSYAKWMPDGRRLLLMASRRGHGTGLYIVDPASRAPARAFSPEGAGRLGWDAVSPDGRLVAAVNPDNQVLLYPVDGSAARPVPGAQPGELPVRWSDDGRYLWVVWRSTLPAKLFRIDVATGRRELWKELAPQDRIGVISVNSVAVTPDGAAYAYSVGRQLSELYVADGLR